MAARSQEDPAFLLKLGCSCSADALVVLTVNMACRGARFWPDLDAVLSQVRRVLAWHTAGVMTFIPVSVEQPMVCKYACPAAADDCSSCLAAVRARCPVAT